MTESGTQSGYQKAVNDLVNYETSGEAASMVIQVGPYSAFLLAAALQLAWRHPDMGGSIRDFVEKTGRAIQDRFREMPRIYELIEAGWDLGQDLRFSEIAEESP